MRPRDTATTELERTRHTPVYRERLARGVAVFEAWLARSRLCASDILTTSRLADGHLADFVQHSFEASAPFWLTKHAVLGIQNQQCWRGQLPRAWNALKSWQQGLPSRHRAPLPSNIMQVAFLTGLSWGLEDRSMSLMIPLAICIRVGFGALLRPGEIHKLRFTDIWIRWEGGRVSGAILTIVEPKNRNFLGKTQFALLRDPGAARYLHWLKSSAPAGAKIWPSTPNMFRTLFGRLMDRSGFGKMNFLPSSLRAGGATALFLDGGCDVLRLQHMGRWASAGSLHCYIQEAVAHMVWVQLGAGVETQLAALVARSRLFLDGAPDVPFGRFATTPRGWRTASTTLAEPRTAPRSSSAPPATSNWAAGHSPALSSTRRRRSGLMDGVGARPPRSSGRTSGL